MIWIFRVQPENLHIHYSMLNHWIVKWARKKECELTATLLMTKKSLTTLILMAYLLITLNI